MFERQKKKMNSMILLTNRKYLVICIFIIFFCMLGESTTQAATFNLLMAEGSGLRNNGSGNFGGTVGVQFTVGSVPLLITSLGLWDGPNSGSSEGDGLEVAADVGLWNVSGSPLASVSIAQNSMGSFVDGSSASCVFASLTTPVTLNANSTYIIGAYYTSSGNAFTNNPEATALFSTSVNVTDGKYFSGGSSLTFPTSSDPANLFGSATMRFSEVPVPGAVWFFGTGLIGLLGLRRKFRK